MAGRSDRNPSKTGSGHLLQPGSIRPVPVPCPKERTTRPEEDQVRGELCGPGSRCRRQGHANAKAANWSGLARQANAERGAGQMG